MGARARQKGRQAIWRVQSAHNGKKAKQRPLLRDGPESMHTAQDAFGPWKTPGSAPADALRLVRAQGRFILGNKVGEVWSIF